MLFAPEFDEMICYVIGGPLIVLLLFLLSQVNQQTLWLLFYARFFPQRLEHLRGKRVWILGCSTGIGEQLAYALARLECRLVLTATTESKLSEVKQKCLAESKGSLTSDDVVVCPFDWCDLSAHQSIVAKVFERFGTIDVLFVNAARIRVNLFENLDHSDWDFIYKCNLMAPLSLIRHVISKWRSQGRPGRIMFTSSLTACTVVPLYACYASAKVAMQHALDYINVEQSLYDIKCNWVSPGPVRTDIFKKSDLTADPFEGRYRTIEAKKCAELMLHSLVNDLRNPLITDDLRAHLMGYAGHHLQSWTVKAICFLYGHDSSLQQEVQRYHR